MTLRDELAGAIYGALSGSFGDFGSNHSKRAAGAILPIIERETTRARAEVASLIRAHQDAEAAYWAMADDTEDETAKRLATEVTRTYEALLASVEGES